MKNGPNGAGLVLFSGGLAAGPRRTSRAEGRAALLYILEHLEPRVLLAAGDLDLTFGQGGKVITSLTGGFDAATSAIVLDDGNLLVGGSVTVPNGGGANVALARYNPDGSLDTSFGDGGTTIIDQDAAGTGFLQIALASDGDILLATDVHRPGQMSDFALFRFDSGGHLDDSFGDHGLVRTDVSDWDIPQSLDVRADGKIVISGWARKFGYGVDENGRANTKSQGVVLRYNPDGTPDNGFGQDGLVSIQPTADNDWVLGRAVLAPDGAVLFAGGTSNLTANTGHAILERIADDGTITDLPFGHEGDGIFSAVKDFKIDAHGRIVLLMSSHDGLRLGRLNADGSPDPSFGNGGWAKRPELSLYPTASLRVAKDDSILVAGQEGDFEGQFTLAHYLPDGSIDSAFGQGGVVTTAFNSGHGETTQAVAFGNNGTIVVVGHNTDNRQHESKFLIARYDGGSMGGSGEYVDGDIVENLPGGGDGGDSDEGDNAGESGSDSGDGGGGGATPAQGGAAPFSLVSAAASDGTVFGKDQDLLGRAEDLF
ncbi:MAG TPA: delta-60 repeat domain-containing protein [Tepidisphaeraceae bacterium]|jgi:uncharacterized delta-60 repeat protein